MCSRVTLLAIVWLLPTIPLYYPMITSAQEVPAVTPPSSVQEVPTAPPPASALSQEVEVLLPKDQTVAEAFRTLAEAVKTAHPEIVIKKSDASQQTNVSEIEATLRLRPNTTPDEFARLFQDLPPLGVKRFRITISTDEKNTVIITAPPQTPWSTMKRLTDYLTLQEHWRFEIGLKSDDKTFAISDDPAAKRQAQVMSAEPSASVPVDVAKTDPVMEMQVFSLKHCVAREVVNVVKQALPNPLLELTADSRTNVLIARGPADELMEVAALLEKLDIPVAEKPYSAIFESHSYDRAAETTPQNMKRKSNEHEAKIATLVAELRGKNSVERNKEQLQLLRAEVAQLFALRQEQQQVELKEFSARLQRIAKSIETRDRIADEIINRRVEELLDPNLSWEVPGVTSGAKSAATPTVKTEVPGGAGVETTVAAIDPVLEGTWELESITGVDSHEQGVKARVRGNLWTVIRSGNVGSTYQVRTMRLPGYFSDPRGLIDLEMSDPDGKVSKTELGIYEVIGDHLIIAWSKSPKTDGKRPENFSSEDSRIHTWKRIRTSEESGATTDTNLPAYSLAKKELLSKMQGEWIFEEISEGLEDVLATVDDKRVEMKIEKDLLVYETTVKGQRTKIAWNFELIGPESPQFIDLEMDPNGENNLQTIGIVDCDGTILRMCLCRWFGADLEQKVRPKALVPGSNVVYFKCRRKLPDGLSKAESNETEQGKQATIAVTDPELNGEWKLESISGHNFTENYRMSIDGRTLWMPHLNQSLRAHMLEIDPTANPKKLAVTPKGPDGSVLPPDRAIYKILGDRLIITWARGKPFDKYPADFSHDSGDVYTWKRIGDAIKSTETVEAVPPKNDQASEQLLANLQGEWVAEEMCDGLEDALAPLDNRRMEVGIDKNILTYRMKFKDQLQTLSLKLEPKTSGPPNAVDVIIDPNGDADRTFGIIECDGNTLRLCLCKPDAELKEWQRPRIFVPGSEVDYLKCRRKVAADSIDGKSHTKSFDELLDHLAVTHSAIKNLSVTTEYKQRILHGTSATIELAYVTKGVIDNQSRSWTETIGQQAHLEPNRNSSETYNGRWLGVFDNGAARSLEWRDGNAPKASIDAMMSWHGIDPREYTTHFQNILVTEHLRRWGGTIDGDAQWEGRRVMTVHTNAVGIDHNNRYKFQFLVDPLRAVVVRRAILFQSTEDHPWREFQYIEGTDHREVAPKIWVPMTVKSFMSAGELSNQKISWTHEATNRDWQVNRDLPIDTFELQFPEGVAVDDRRPAKPETP